MHWQSTKQQPAVAVHGIALTCSIPDRQSVGVYAMFLDMDKVHKPTSLGTTFSRSKTQLTAILFDEDSESVEPTQRCRHRSTAHPIYKECVATSGKVPPYIDSSMDRASPQPSTAQCSST